MKSVILGALLLLAAAFPAWGVNPTARSRLDSFARDVHALSCQFTQTTLDARGGEKSIVHGSLALAAPRQFRWSTTGAERQVIVADGARVWIYDPDLDQVTVRRQSSEEAHSPLTVLTDLAQMDRQFKVSEAGQHDGMAWLRLVPRGDGAELSAAELGFDATGNLAAMRFTYASGSGASITFTNWQRNPNLAPATFTFTPPPGTDVVGDAVEVPEIHPLGH